MRLMALEAQERFALDEQVPVDRTVRKMTGAAIVGHIRMLVEERPLLLGVALRARLLHRVTPEATG